MYIDESGIKYQSPVAISSTVMSMKNIEITNRMKNKKCHIIRPEEHIQNSIIKSHKQSN